MSGIGKTQIATEYAYRYSYDYDVIWWINAERSAMIRNAYADLADKIGLIDVHSRDQNTATDVLKRWLEGNSRWLLILDNAQDLTDLQKFLPRGGGGHVIITSPNMNWGTLSEPIKIKEFSKLESIEFILKRTGQNNKEDADELAIALYGLTLALSQAGTYIEETGSTLADYLKLFNLRRNELWEEETSPQDYPNTVEVTFGLAIDKIKKESLDAVDLSHIPQFTPSHNTFCAHYVSK